MTHDKKQLLPIERFLWSLDIVEREGRHLRYSWETLFGSGNVLDSDWVAGLDQHPEEAVRLEAFVSRFGRMQDTIADKLIPRWLQSLAERTGSQIENLDRAERLGVLESTEEWLVARKLRNQLIHEYMQDPVAFSEALYSARRFSMMLMATYNNLRDYAEQRMSLDSSLPEPLVLPDQHHQ
ncbi:hypothetical protein [Halomonas lysinitropha]|uniref:Uncharacterized protein n=1 Tax=Halomonas lysinitropha TaxID=2607506 RepID=A0A5K1I8I4_9GAMM|nr:hypothetical protein [Halomonas lysinitropha]VVZ95342.1 hypothetical protein HALO32_01407 [Halomonas lysinitropha]